MDKETVLLTIWVTVWNSYCKKTPIEAIRDFAGDEYYFDALNHIRTKANKLGYKTKFGRKYISLVKES